MASDSSPSRVGVFSDIHANLYALDAVLQALNEEGIAAIYCCGDVVGYGPHPNECCKRLRERNIPTIAGNHDHAAIGLTDTQYFNEIAKAAVLWTAETLEKENVDYLRELPMTRELDECLFVHASPRDPREWNYILTLGEARSNFEAFSHRICFIGHSHQPFVVENRQGSLNCPTTTTVSVHPDSQYLVNVGSAGQPRDRNPRACYLIYDRESSEIAIRRVAYDLDAVQAAISERGLPMELGERLYHGW